LRRDGGFFFGEKPVPGESARGHVYGYTFRRLWLNYYHFFRFRNRVNYSRLPALLIGAPNIHLLAHLQPLYFSLRLVLFKYLRPLLIGLSLLRAAFAEIHFDKSLEMSVDGEVVSGFMVVTDSAGIVIFGEVFSAGKAKDVAALSKNRFEEELQADRALKSRFLQQFLNSIKLQLFHLRFPLPPDYPRPHPFPKLFM
jgi:hypothetical protein